MTDRDGSWLDDTLKRLTGVRAAVFGDLCLDAYWTIDPGETELSLETGLPVQRVRQQRYSLGGAGNVAANLRALGVADVRVVGMVGDDLFGAQMVRLLGVLNLDVRWLLTDQADWQTPVYAKPFLEDREQSRIDFGGFDEPSIESLRKMTASLHDVAEEVDIVVLNQQLPRGVCTDAMIERLNAVISAHPQCRFIVDSRHRADRFVGAILKVNAHEAARLLGETRPSQESIPDLVVRAMALRLTEKTGRAVFITRGGHGLVAAVGDEFHDVPGIEFAGPIDPVGAGDTARAALAAVLGSGGDIRIAAIFANIAASVTASKLQTTGTASPEEIRAVTGQPG